MKLKNVLEASSISRIIDYIKKGKPFLMVSAYNKEKSKKENDQRMKDLAKRLRDFDLGFLLQRGYYVHDDGVGAEEKSFIATSNEKSTSEMMNIGKALGREFDQESVLYYDGEKGYFVYSDGGIDDLGMHLSALSMDRDHIDMAGGYSDFKGGRYVLGEPDPDNPNVAGRHERKPRGDFSDMFEWLPYHINIKKPVEIAKVDFHGGKSLQLFYNEKMKGGSVAPVLWAKEAKGRTKKITSGTKITNLLAKIRTDAELNIINHGVFDQMAEMAAKWSNAESRMDAGAEQGKHRRSHLRRQRKDNIREILRPSILESYPKFLVLRRTKPVEFLSVKDESGDGYTLLYSERKRKYPTLNEPSAPVVWMRKSNGKTKKISSPGDIQTLLTKLDKLSRLGKINIEVLDEDVYGHLPSLVKSVLRDKKHNPNRKLARTYGQAEDIPKQAAKG